MKLRFLFGLSILLISVVAVCGGRLPVRVYTTAEGLADDGVIKIVRDSRDFLWLCTAEGLSRFDGTMFRNYTQQQGLPNRKINDFLETRAGDLLVATRGGLTVFNPNGYAYRWNNLESRLEQTADEAPMFRRLPLPEPYTDNLKQSVLALGEDNWGRIYVGTLDGVFLLGKSNGEWQWLKKIETEWWVEGTVFTDFKTDALGFVWTITNRGIFRFAPDGRVEQISGEGGSRLLVERRTGEIWATSSGLPNGIRIYSVPSDASAPVLVRNYKKADGLPAEKFITDIIQTVDGRIFCVDGFHALEFAAETKESEPKFRVVADGNFTAAAEDAGGNLWLGTPGEGAWKIVLNGFVKFDASDGVPNGRVSALYTAPGGDFYITSGERQISHFNFERGNFETIEPFGLTTRHYTKMPLDFQTASREWWIPASNSILRYPPVKNFKELARTPPAKIYTEADGLGGDGVYNLFEDSRGDIWITIDGLNPLQKLERASGKIISFTTADGLPSRNAPISFAEDAGGNIWFGFYFGGLARYRNGRFEFFNARDGIPENQVGDLFRDSRGRLWISTTSFGVFRVDEPTAEKPVFRDISTSEGLSSNQATCATEDSRGRIYIGTGRGINRIEPETGIIKLYTQADGLPGSLIFLCGRDSSGSLWFALKDALVRFLPPVKDNERIAPPIFIGGASVAGNKQTVSELGQTQVALPEFNHRQNNLQIDFFSIGFASADRIRFQYRLKNAADNDWSQPTAERAVTFANLAPGEYRFEVRAVNAEGSTSAQPAVVAFTIASPTWQKRWFIAICLLAAGLIIFAFERYRAAKINALKSAFGELSLSEKRFRQLVEQSPLGIIIFNPDGSMRVANQGYMDMWGAGFRFEDIKNWDFMNDQQLVAGGIVEGLGRAFEGEVVVFDTMRYDLQKNAAGLKVAPDSGVVYIDAVAYPVKGADGRLREVICVLQDSTEQYIAKENLEKMRAEKARELEQVRKRIAADLHDDIGSSLTQISIWSEVLRQNNVSARQNGGAEALNLIADSSRELVDAMSDIVWAINPQKDHLSDLIGKMRRFAADSFTPRRIKFTFDAPDLAEDLTLGANLRRELFLIFKEAVNNIVKHADCRLVEIVFKIETGAICLTIRDDGCGLSVAAASSGDGHGLSSMKERAASLGGSLQINSSAQTGTKLEIIVPLNAPGETN